MIDPEWPRVLALTHPWATIGPTHITDMPPLGPIPPVTSKSIDVAIRLSVPTGSVEGRVIARDEFRAAGQSSTATPTRKGGSACPHRLSSSGPRAGSTSTAPTPTRRAPSTASSSAGPPSRRRRGSGVLRLHEGRQGRRRLHAQRRVHGIPRRLGHPPDDRRRPARRQRARPRTAARSRWARWTWRRTAARR